MTFRVRAVRVWAETAAACWPALSTLATLVKLLALVALVTLLTAISVGPVGAQEGATAAPLPAPASAGPQLDIVAPPDRDDARVAVAGRVDAVVGALSEVLGAGIEGPWVLRLHSHVDDLLRANPLAVESGGVVGGSRRSRHEADLVLPAQDEVPTLDAALRGEVARLLVLQRSNAALPDVWVQGTADYLAASSADAGGVARLRDAWDRGSLPSWAAISKSDGAYLDPPLVRPLALSALHFLVGRDDLAGWLAVLDAVGTGQSFSEAVQAAYGVDVDTLDAEWRAWLQEYLDGGWQAHALYGPDLARARALLASGNATETVRLLGPALPLVDLEHPDAALEVRQVLDAAQASGASLQALSAGSAALAAGDYAQAGRLAQQVLSDADAPPDQSRLAHDLAERARLGSAARVRADAAARLPKWRAFQARTWAASAAVDFARIGSDTAALRAMETAGAASGRLRPAGWVLLAAGAGLLAWNVWARRRSPGGSGA